MKVQRVVGMSLSGWGKFRREIASELNKIRLSDCFYFFFFLEKVDRENTDREGEGKEAGKRRERERERK